MKKITPKKHSSSAFSLFLISGLTTFSFVGVAQAQTTNNSATQFLNTVNVINANPGNTPQVPTSISLPQVQNFTNTLQITAPLPQNNPSSGVTLRNDTVLFTGVGRASTGTGGTNINTPLNQSVPFSTPVTSANDSIGTTNTGNNSFQSAIALTPQQIQGLTNALLLISSLPQAISGSGVTFQAGNVVFSSVRGTTVESSINSDNPSGNTNIPVNQTTPSEVQSTTNNTAPAQTGEDRSISESAALPIPPSNGNVEISVPLIPFLQGSANTTSVPLMAQSLITPASPTVASTVKLGNMTVALSEQLAGSVKGLLASDTVNIDRLNTAFGSYNNLVKEMGLTSKEQLTNFPQLRKVGFVLASLRNLARQG